MDFKKIQLAQFILGLTDVSMLDKIGQLVGTDALEGTQEPCHYTLEEVRKKLSSSVDDAIAGRGISHEDVEREALNWI